MAEFDYRGFWDESLLRLKKELNNEDYDQWFSKIEYARSDESAIFVLVPSKFFLDIFREKYFSKLKAQINEVAEKKLDITLEVRKKNEKQPEQISSGEKQAPQEKTTGNAKTQASSGTILGGEKRKKHPQLQENFTFDTYVVGEDNSFAFNAASAVARNPGSKEIYNPLLIYGGTGLGKTHLMQAIGHYIHENSDLKILYITGEGFMREFVELFTYNQKNKDSFAKKYRNVDALLIDDIHTIEKGAGTQDELFYTFEALYNKKKQMVFTCDRPIAELKGMAPRLQSRFQSGISVELHMPKYEELIAILKKKMAIKKQEIKKDIDISDEVIELIVKNISTNVRDLEGALNKLLGYADLVNKPITKEIAQRELKDNFADPKQGNMSMEIIQKVVADDYHLTLNDLKGKKKSAGIAKPRHIAVYLCRELTEYSLTEIGQVFNDRDHATILHSHRLIEEESRSDTNLYSALEKLKRLIKEYNVK